MFIETFGLNEIHGNRRKDMPDWDPKHFEKQTLTSGPYPNNSFIGVFDTAVEITGVKASPGSTAFCVADKKLYICTDGTSWFKSKNTFDAA
tara:strand:+ start:205 stop:477 length:273 start_codon:yes stop_codon:yes gene_type:complete